MIKAFAVCLQEWYNILVWDENIEGENMKSNSKNIAVLSTGADSDLQARMLKGIEIYGKAHGYNIAVFHWFTGAYEREKHNLGEVNMAYLPDLSLFDGVIIFSNTFHIEENKRRMEELLEKLTCPIVCVGSKMADYYHVECDGYAAMRKMVEHFVTDHKMTRIHFVKGVAGNPDAEARFKAYEDVLSEHGIPVIPERISQGDFYVTGAERAAKEIFSSKLPFPEAVICANDTMAMTICACMQEKGYRVPEDVCVAGYDYSFEGQHCDPKLTTVRTRFREMGETACKVLIDVLSGKEVPKETLLEDEVIFGDSCGCSAKNKDVVMLEEAHGEVFHRKMVHQMIELEKNITVAKDYIGWLEAMKDFVKLVDPSEFYFCTNEDFVETVFERSYAEQESMSLEEKLAYSPMTKVLIAYQNGVFKEKEPFESGFALDDIFKDKDKAKLYFFSPLHCLERNYGYFVFVDSDYVIDNQLYVYWLISIGHSVENIRKQNLLQNAMKRLDEMYIKDSLTGAYNRFGMERFFAEIKMKSIMSKSKIQISFMDLDGLKIINDKFGHEEGDRIINAAAEILMKNAGKYYVIRYGGDEFIVMGTAQNAKEAEAYWKKVQDDIDDYNANHKKHATLSMSYGYDIFNIDHKTYLEDCIRVTDNKMYEEKKRKKAAADLQK